MRNARLMMATAALGSLFACVDNRGLSAGGDGSVPSTGGVATSTGGAKPGTGGAGGIPTAATGSGGTVSTGGTATTGGTVATGGMKTGVGGAAAAGGAKATGGTSSGGITSSGGGAGSGGRVGGAGGSVCGPVCLIYCAYGNELDENGCELCKCKPGQVDAGTSKDTGRDVLCPPLCDLYCPYGNELDGNGCELCKCKPAPADAGATKDTGMACPPVCAITCPNGNVLDSNGCPTCACKPDPIDALSPVDTRICPTIACPAIGCAYGYAKDGNGCPTCRCNPDPTVCPPTKCKVCPFGYVKDPANGCDTCDCAPDPGTACAELTNEAACSAVDNRCRWLVRGCTEPALPVTGCYDKTLIDCTSTCPSGTTCLPRSIDPCHNLGCQACAQTINICL